MSQLCSGIPHELQLKNNIPYSITGSEYFLGFLVTGN